MLLNQILLVLAFVLFLLAAIGIPATSGRFNLIAAGLAFWTLAILTGGLNIGAK